MANSNSKSDGNQLGTTLLVKRASSPSLAMDVTSAYWTTVPVAPIRLLWSGELAQPTRKASAQLSWSDEALHVRFVCAQHEPLVISDSPVVSRKTLGLWDRDVCEIFVAPDLLTPERYFEFEAAPTGEWVDLGIHVTPDGRETDWDYDSGMSVTTLREEQQLIIAMKIPFSKHLPVPSSGDEWRGNLFRCVGPESPERYLAWQPTFTPEPNFHVPDVFGKFRFQ